MARYDEMARNYKAQLNDMYGTLCDMMEQADQGDLDLQELLFEASDRVLMVRDLLNDREMEEVWKR